MALPRLAPVAEGTTGPELPDYASEPSSGLYDRWRLENGSPTPVGQKKGSLGYMVMNDAQQHIQTAQTIGLSGDVETAKRHVADLDRWIDRNTDAISLISRYNGSDESRQAQAAQAKRLLSRSYLREEVGSKDMATSLAMLINPQTNPMYETRLAVKSAQGGDASFIAAIDSSNDPSDAPFQQRQVLLKQEAERAVREGRASDPAFLAKMQDAQTMLQYAYERSDALGGKGEALRVMDSIAALGGGVPQQEAMFGVVGMLTKDDPTPVARSKALSMINGWMDLFNRVGVAGATLTNASTGQPVPASPAQRELCMDAIASVASLAEAYDQQTGASYAEDFSTMFNSVFTDTDFNEYLKAAYAQGYLSSPDKDQNQKVLTGLIAQKLHDTFPAAGVFDKYTGGAASVRIGMGAASQLSDMFALPMMQEVLTDEQGNQVVREVPVPFAAAEEGYGLKPLCDAFENACRTVLPGMVSREGYSSSDEAMVALFSDPTLRGEVTRLTAGSTGIDQEVVGLFTEAVYQQMQENPSAPLDFNKAWVAITSTPTGSKVGKYDIKDAKTLQEIREKPFKTDEDLTILANAEATAAGLDPTKAVSRVGRGGDISQVTYGQLTKDIRRKTDALITSHGVTDGAADSIYQSFAQTFNELQEEATNGKQVSTEEAITRFLSADREVFKGIDGDTFYFRDAATYYQNSDMYRDHFRDALVKFVTSGGENVDEVSRLIENAYLSTRHVKTTQQLEDTQDLLHDGWARDFGIIEEKGIGVWNDETRATYLAAKDRLLKAASQWFADANHNLTREEKDRDPDKVIPLSWTSAARGDYGVMSLDVLYEIGSQVDPDAALDLQTAIVDAVYGHEHALGARALMGLDRIGRNIKKLVRDKAADTQTQINETEATNNLIRAVADLIPTGVGVGGAVKSAGRAGLGLAVNGAKGSAHWLPRAGRALRTGAYMSPGLISSGMTLRDYALARTARAGYDSDDLAFGAGDLRGFGDAFSVDPDVPSAFSGWGRYGLNFVASWLGAGITTGPKGGLIAATGSLVVTAASDIIAYFNNKDIPEQHFQSLSDGVQQEIAKVLSDTSFTTDSDRRVLQNFVTDTQNDLRRRGTVTSKEEAQAWFNTVLRFQQYVTNAKASYQGLWQASTDELYRGVRTYEQRLLTLGAEAAGRYAGVSEFGVCQDATQANRARNVLLTRMPAAFNRSQVDACNQAVSRITANLGVEAKSPVVAQIQQMAYEATNDYTKAVRRGEQRPASLRDYVIARVTTPAADAVKLRRVQQEQDEQARYAARKQIDLNVDLQKKQAAAEYAKERDERKQANTQANIKMRSDEKIRVAEATADL